MNVYSAFCHDYMSGLSTLYILSEVAPNHSNMTAYASSVASDLMENVNLISTSCLGIPELSGFATAYIY